MEKILRSYLRRLTNLSGNNRSLLLLRLIVDQFIDLHEFNYLKNEPSFKIIESILAGNQQIVIADEFDSRDHHTNKTSQKLRRLERIENFIFQERGAKDLYVGWPFIRGKFSDGTLVRCPLIFYPVTIQRHQNQWILSQRKDVNITFNKTFLLAYAYYNHTSLDEELIEYVLNDLDSDSIAYRTQLYDILKQSHLEINFNQDNFTDTLNPFQNFNKEQFDESQKAGELKLYPEAVIGIFPQAGSYLVPDYVKLLEDQNMENFESFFADRHKNSSLEPSAVRYSDQVKEENTFTPYKLDAYQEDALKRIKSGESMTIQGPPGSGKSQLICNLISDFIARGKNVLVVCQKKAALDVVYNRLKSNELHDFVGLVHDFKNDRKNIFEQIAKQIDSLDEYRQKNNGLDAIYLERTFLQNSRKIDQSVEELDEFKKALFDDSECGKSIKELYLTSDPNTPSINLNQQYRNLTYPEADKFVGLISKYFDYHHKFEKKQPFWLSGPSFAEFTSQDFVKIKSLLADIPEFENFLQSASQKFTDQNLDYETSLHLLLFLEDLHQLKTNLDNDLVYSNYKKMISHKPDQNAAWMTQMERSIMQCYKGDGLESSLNTGELGRFQEALENAIKSKKNPIKWLKWNALSDEKMFVGRVLVANDLKNNKQDFQKLLQRIDNRLNYEHLVSQLDQRKWLENFPKNFRKIDIQNWFFYQKLSLKCLETSEKTRVLTQFISPNNESRKTFISKLDELIQLLEEIPARTASWNRYFEQNQIRSILLGKENISMLNKQLSENFDAIVEYHKIKNQFGREQQKVIDDLLEIAPDSKSAAVSIFLNSLALAWIEHIETKFPILRAISSYKIDHLSQELKEAISEKMQVSQQILLLKSRERTYQNLEYNRLNNLVTYRDLYHQVTKKRKIWPIRRVISHFHEEVFSLLPCWLASPESASAIFPMEKVFDLVIFDEASQCFAERGIPAMYRGRQIVVVGDDQQLQPNDLYRVRWENEDDDMPELEVDSLLSLSKQYLNETTLKGHYRSKSLELIEFSNRNFYQGKLKLLPDFHRLKKNRPAIHYTKTAGIWENNSNQEEATTVVDLVAEIQKKSPDKSIGIVTFNVYQQNLILDLLEEKPDLLQSSIGELLFVKNIENVQGDERDIIIFSTTYGPDTNGKIQLRFGSLNQSGGENRLNVAITRAREEIHIITSLFPHQLQTENTSNRGPKLLREYLEYAQKVSNGAWSPDSMEEISFDQNWYLKNKLKSSDQSMALYKSLPFADLSLFVNDDLKGLILTDDELYYQSISSKDAHCYIQDNLQEKNWPNIQFYSREYWMDQKVALEKLEKFIIRNS